MLESVSMSRVISMFKADQGLAFFSSEKQTNTGDPVYFAIL